MKEKAAAREAALKLTIESAGGKLELFNWTVPGSDYNGVTITEFPDAGTYTAVVSLVEATGRFRKLRLSSFSPQARLIAASGNR